MRILRRRCRRCGFEWVQPEEMPEIPACPNCGGSGAEIQDLGILEKPEDERPKDEPS